MWGLRGRIGEGKRKYRISVMNPKEPKRDASAFDVSNRSLTRFFECPLHV
jgi:hypothetical protein